MVTPITKVIEINTGISGVRFVEGDHIAEAYDTGKQLLYVNSNHEKVRIELLLIIDGCNSTEEFYVAATSSVDDTYAVTNIPELRKWVDDE